MFIPCQGTARRHVFPTLKQQFPTFSRLLSLAAPGQLGPGRQTLPPPFWVGGGRRLRSLKGRDSDLRYKLSALEARLHSFGPSLDVTDTIAICRQQGLFVKEFITK